MNIWDTTGKGKFLTVNRGLVLGANGALICADLTKKFDSVAFEQQLNGILENLDKKCALAIIGTIAGRTAIYHPIRLVENCNMCSQFIASNLRNIRYALILLYSFEDNFAIQIQILEKS